MCSMGRPPAEFACVAGPEPSIGTARARMWKYWSVRWHRYLSWRVATHVVVGQMRLPDHVSLLPPSTASAATHRGSPWCNTAALQRRGTHRPGLRVSASTAAGRNPLKPGLIAARAAGGLRALSCPAKCLTRDTSTDICFFLANSRLTCGRILVYYLFELTSEMGVLSGAFHQQGKSQEGRENWA